MFLKKTFGNQLFRTFKWRKRMPWFTAFAATCPNKVIQTPLLEEESVESTKAHLNRGISVLKSVGHSNESTHPLPLMDTMHRLRLCAIVAVLLMCRYDWLFSLPGRSSMRETWMPDYFGVRASLRKWVKLYKWILNPLLSGMHITPYIPGGVSPVLGRPIWAAQGQP